MRLWRLVSLGMAVLFPISMVATDAAVSGFPSGKVAVNGVAVSHPVTVLAGDRIDTQSGTLAMTMTGSSVEVEPSSSVVYTSEAVNIVNGGVRVVTTRELPGQVRNLGIRPVSSARSVYTVAEHDGKIFVAALEGTLAIGDGHQQVTLAANHALAFPIQQDAQTSSCKKNDKDCKAKAAAAGQVATTSGTAVAGATVSTAVAVSVAAAVAAASAALSYGLAVATEATGSPSVP